MKSKNNNSIVIASLIVIIVILAILCVLFATGTISFHSNDVDNNEISDSDNNYDEGAYDNSSNFEISMNNVKVSKDSPNAKILVTGDINVSYDDTQYLGVALSGYCLGSNNEKFLMHGPGDGSSLFYKDNNKLTLTEKIPQNVEYSDGTTKSWDEIDWDNVKIKYCKIEKMTEILIEGTTHPETILNIEKNFDK